jgi:hypothetical protein
MKKVLLGTTALLGAGTIAGAAQASDGIKLDIGGFFKSAYVMSFDKDKSGSAGHGRTFDKLTNDSEIYFKGETTLDNGITVGARVELEAETAGDQIDMSYGYFQGGFGKVVLGTQNDALETTCVIAPGGTPNFSGYSPSGSGDNSPTFSNYACTSATDHSLAVSYYSPVFAGFSFGMTYTPETGHDGQGDGGAGYGMFTHGVGQETHVGTLALNYDLPGDGWGLHLNAGGSWALGGDPIGDHQHAGDAYYGAAAFDIGGFSVGGTFNYFNNDGHDNDAWVAGGGLAYNVDAWTVGLQYSHANFAGVNAAYNIAASGLNPTAQAGHRSNNRVALTGNYDMGPGIGLDADLAYSWYHDTDPATSSTADDYHAFEVGVGTHFDF